MSFLFHFCLASDSDTDDKIVNKTTIETIKPIVDVVETLKEAEEEKEERLNESSTESTDEKLSPTTDNVNKESIVAATEDDAEKTKDEKKND